METTAIYKSHWLNTAHLNQLLMRVHLRISAKLRQSKPAPTAQTVKRPVTMKPTNSAQKLSSSDILTTIYRHHFDTRCLNLAVHGKTVTVNGIVESETEKGCIEAIIHAIPGINAVKNLLQII